MNMIFFGNTKYSLLGLQIVNKAYPISFIVTIFNSPVAQFAKNSNIPFLQTSQLNEEVLTEISSKNPDFLIVEDYGLILPDKLLALPKYAPLNIHHSLLPKYRGPSPAPTAILNGERLSGVTVIKMTDKIDAGDILAQVEYELKPDETTDSLLIVLNTLGGELVSEVIKNYGSIKPKPQNESQATFTSFIKKEDGYFDLPAGRQELTTKFLKELDKMIRAYYPWPNVWTRLRQDYGGQALKGKIVKFYPGDLIQMEGKKIMQYKDFLNGYPNFPLKTLS